MKFVDIETAFEASIGLDEIVNEQLPIALRHPVSFGDLYVCGPCHFLIRTSF